MAASSFWKPLMSKTCSAFYAGVRTLGTGRWGFEMGPEITDRNWHFQNRGKTTAEIILDLYRTIRQSAGDAVLIGCNTIGHLAAGLVEAQRIGDDTSGREWSR